MKKRTITTEINAKYQGAKTFINISDEIKFVGKMEYEEIPTTFKELRETTIQLIINTPNKIEDTADGFKLKLFNHNKEFVGSIYFCKDKTVWFGMGFELKRTIPQMYEIVKNLVEK